MICERCGKQLIENTTICPACGTVVNKPSQTSKQPPTAYGQFPLSDFGEASSTPGQTPQHTAYTSPSMYQEVVYQTPASDQIYISQPLRQTRPTYTPPTSATKQNSSIDNALFAEIILSLFGIFGVGWLAAGETAIGIILLACSVLIYWPIMLFGTALTEGFGLICLAPFAIGTIILNILLLNAALKRKAWRARRGPAYRFPPREQ